MSAVENDATLRRYERCYEVARQSLERTSARLHVATSDLGTADVSEFFFSDLLSELARTVNALCELEDMVILIPDNRG